MSENSGKCVGGPFNGKYMSDKARIVELPESKGSYVFALDGYWRWIEDNK